jgi:tetratricopeptide (TPR) repeat protein
MDANFRLAHIFLSLIYREKGMYEQAISERAMTLSEGSPEKAARVEASLKNAYKEKGEEGLWRKQIDLLKEGSKQSGDYLFWMTEAYIRLNDKEKAFDLLEKAIESGHPATYVLKVDPTFDPLRRDPRFRVLLQRVGLEL